MSLNGTMFQDIGDTHTKEKGLKRFKLLAITHHHSPPSRKKIIIIVA
jgi:hypothetical protein